MFSKTNNYNNLLLDSYEEVNRNMLRLIFIHWIVASTISGYLFDKEFMGFIVGGILFSIAIYSYNKLVNESTLRVILALVLASYTILFIQQNSGYIEVHFYTFVMLSILTIYKDTKPLTFATIFLLLYNIIVCYFQPSGVTIFGESLIVFEMGHHVDSSMFFTIFLILQWLIQYNIINHNKKQFFKLYKLNESIKKDRDFTNTIINASQNPIIAVNKDNKIIIFNRAAEELFNYKSSNILNMASTNLIISKPYVSSINDKINSLFKGINVDKISNEKLEIYAISSKGSIFIVKISLNIAETNNIKMVLLNIVDISEEQANRQKLLVQSHNLKTMNDKLESKVKKEVAKNMQQEKLHQEQNLANAKFTAIGQLSAGITHEINTPLTYIKGNLEMMGYDIDSITDTSLKNSMKGDIYKINDGVVRISNIVESMREMSQKSSAKKEPYNIYATLITSLTMAYNKAKQITPIYLNRTIFTIGMNSKTFDFIAPIQKQRIEQVWVIIISNALDELIKVENYDDREFFIDIKESDTAVTVDFKDNAGGVDESIIKNIFEPFTSTKESSGMGVGLNIAKNIIDDHNGEIEVFNTMKDNKKYATFRVTLQK